MTVPSWIAELPVESAAMTAEQFRKRLKALGLSQVEFARRAGLHWRSVQRYASGDRPIPAVVVALLECWETIARLKRELDG